MSSRPTKLVGAFYNKRANRWWSQIKMHGRSVYLGHYDTEELAHAAYTAARSAVAKRPSGTKPKERPFLIDEGIVKATLPNGLVCLMDEVDFYAFRHLHMSAHRPRSSLTSYVYGHGPGMRTAPLHRLILDAPSGMEVDHINGNGLDNRRANLRLCTGSQNSCNKGLNRSNTSGFKGVTLDKKSGRWHARIAVNGESRSLGFYGTPESAYEAYVQASKTLHGEFARHGRRLEATRG